MSENLANQLKRQIYGRKLTGYLILTAIGLVFVFFGYGGRNNFTGAGYAARVGNSLISIADFQEEEGRISQYYASLFGGQMDLSSQKGLLQQQALESLIRNELVYQSAQKEGIYSTDAEVRDFIVSSIPAFQENGAFMRERYMAYLENSRTTAGNFENRVRKDIANIRTRQLVEAAAQPSVLEMARQKELSQNKVNVAFLKIDEEAVAQKLKVAPAEASAKLADAAFAKRAEEYFQSHRSEWAKAESVEAQHILIMAKAGDAAAEKKALEKITQLKEKSKKEDFGKLAAANSEDPGSKAKKGQLPSFSRGQMVPEFEKVAFELPVGQVSNPVKTQYGYHLIKVTSHQKATDPKFEDVKVDVASRVIARDRAQEQIKALEASVEKGESVDAQASALGLAWEETGYFDLGTENVPKLAGPAGEAAFEVSAKKPLLNRVIRDQNLKYVLKFKDAKVEPAKEEAAATEVAQLERRRADGIYTGWLNQERAGTDITINHDVIQQR